MSKLQQKITSLVAAVFMCGGVLAPQAKALPISSDPVLTGDALAQITAMSGTVLKRDFVDWDKEVWGDPQQAAKNDKLREGMQIGTGNNSWAEVSWPNVKTRAWSNTVFAIAPNKRLVYLTGGEMLFRLDKHRKDKDQSYYIWTKVLQARIRGTTVLVQAKGTVTRFTVMEGTVDILNRLDHSKVTLKPGAVYEIVGYQSTAGTKGEQPKPTMAPLKISKYVTDTLYDSQEKCKVPIFQDNLSSTNAYPANSEAIKHHPLVTAGGEIIDSMSLIEKEQANLPGFNPLLPIRIADQNGLNKTIQNALSIEAVPSNVSYFIGQSIGKMIPLPQSASMLPFQGVILNPIQYTSSTTQTTVAATTPKALPPIVPLLLPYDQTSAKLANPNQEAAADTAKNTAREIYGEDVEQPMGTENIPQPALLDTCKPALVPYDNPNPAPSAFQPMPNSVPNVTSMGMIAPVAGATGAGTIGAVGGISPTGAINPAATMTPAATTLTNTLTNTLQNTTSGVGRTINNITSGINLH